MLESQVATFSANDLQVVCCILKINCVGCLISVSFPLEMNAHYTHTHTLKMALNGGHAAYLQYESNRRHLRAFTHKTTST